MILWNISMYSTVALLIWCEWRSSTRRRIKLCFCYGPCHRPSSISGPHSCRQGDSSVWGGWPRHHFSCQDEQKLGWWHEEWRLTRQGIEWSSRLIQGESWQVQQLWNIKILEPQKCGVLLLPQEGSREEELSKVKSRSEGRKEARELFYGWSCNGEQSRTFFDFIR